MNLEGISLFALTDYLKQEITGSRIYKIGMPASHAIYLSLKRQHDTIHLIIDVNGAAPCIRLSPKAPENPAEPPAFCMLLRKHLEEGKITRIRQLELDRVIELEISLLEGSGRITAKHLIIELTGKNSNLIFSGDGKILDCIRHISPAMNSVRAVQPGSVYCPPPACDGFNILNTPPEKIVAAIPDAVFPSLWKQLVSHTTGIGKATALQLFAMAKIPAAATYLTPGDRNRLTGSIARLQNSIAALVSPAAVPSPEDAAVSAPVSNDGMPDPGAGHPGPFTAIITETNQCQTVFPFRAEYIPENCRGRYFGTINEALLYVTRLKPEELPRQEALKKTIQSELQKAGKKIKALEQDLSRANDAEIQRITADSLMASLYTIPKGALTCTIPNIYDETLLTVSLSPLLTPAENAQKYYKKYNKLKRAQEEVSRQLTEAKATLQYLESIDASLQMGVSRQEAEEIREELQNTGFLPEAKRKARIPEKSSPLCIRFSGTSKIYVGKNNRQNDEITFKISRSSDLWLHTRNIPGSHVLLRTEGNDPEPEALQAAVQLAAHFSKARGGSQIPVDCVPVRYVKKPSGARPGFVIFTNQKTFYTTPDEEYIRNLLKNSSLK